MRDLRRYINKPDSVNNIEVVFLLFSITSFILAMIAVTAPNWREFANQSGDVFSIGLWGACKNSKCFYAWGSASPIIYFSPGSGANYGAYKRSDS